MDFRDLYRRHFFLVTAVAALILMAVFGGVKLLAGGGANGGEGPPGAAAGRGKGPGGPGMSAPVTAATAAVRTFADRIEVLGVARGRQSVTITSNTTELVTRVRFRDGQFVPKGAVLVDLQATEQDADIILAKASLTQAERQYRRWKELADKGIASPAAMEQHQAAYEQARANLEAAQARRNDRVIRAPFSGVVGLTNIAPGALIAPGGQIATLDDVTAVRVDFDIPDRYLELLQPNQAIVARPDALPGQSFPGHIATLDTRVDEGTRTIKARAIFPNPNGMLRPGMLIRVGVDQGVRQAVAAPEAAVQYAGNRASVFVIARQGERTVARQRLVTLGASQDGFVEIKAGLERGERIVADGLNRIQPDQPVRIVSRAPANAQASLAKGARVP